MKVRLWSIDSAANSSDFAVGSAVQRALDDHAVLIIGDESDLRSIEAALELASIEYLGPLDHQAAIDFQTLYPETGE